MGGTSTDVSRYAGEYEHVFESTVGGVTIQAPQVRMILPVPSYTTAHDVDITRIFTTHGVSS